LSAEYYASPWLLTFFAVLSPQRSNHNSYDSGAFDLNFMLIAIDLFLLEGVVALIRVCLSILNSIEDDLKDLTSDETLVYMKSFVLP